MKVILQAMKSLFRKVEAKIPKKLSECENDLYHPVIWKQVVSLSKDDFEAWVNPDGDTEYLYIIPEKWSWFTSKENVKWSIKASIGGESESVSSDDDSDVWEIVKETTDDGQTAYWMDSSVLPFNVNTGFDYKNWDEYLGKDETVISLVANFFKLATEVSIEISCLVAEAKKISHECLDGIFPNVTQTKEVVLKEFNSASSSMSYPSIGLVEGKTYILEYATTYGGTQTEEVVAQYNSEYGQIMCTANMAGFKVGDTYLYVQSNWASMTGGEVTRITDPNGTVQEQTIPTDALIVDGVEDDYVLATSGGEYVPKPISDYLPLPEIPVVTSSALNSSGVFSVTIEGVTKLKTGMMFVLIPHTDSTSVSPKINVNNLGSKSIFRYQSWSTSLAVGWTYSPALIANKPVLLLYSGSSWISVSHSQPQMKDADGTLFVNHGGTGLSSITEGNYLVGSTDIQLTQKTPAEVLADIGAVPVPTTATVGQTIVVTAVDDNGKPTAWEVADFPTDEHINELIASALANLNN